MRYRYEPINNNGAEIIVRRFLGRLTRVIDEEALRDASRRGSVTGNPRGLTAHTKLYLKEERALHSEGRRGPVNG